MTVIILYSGVGLHMKSPLEFSNSSSTLGEVYSQNSYVIKIIRNLKNVDCFIRVYPVPAPILL